MGPVISNLPLRNAELANGRLALLSAQQRATRVKARAAKTEEEEMSVCSTVIQS